MDSHNHTNDLDWLSRLAKNPHIEAVIIADNDGYILHSSRSLRSDQEYLASMFQALAVLGQTLAQEFASNTMHFVQLTTENNHILLYPLIDSTYFLVIETLRTAPLMVLTIELERIIAEVVAADLLSRQHKAVLERQDVDLNAEELIDAVREWLRRRPVEGDLE